MRIIWLATTLIICAQTALAGTYSDCTEAIKSGDQSQAKELAATILRFNSFSHDEQITGAACLTFAMGQEYVFSIVLNTFAPKAEVAAIIEATKKEAAGKADEQKRLQEEFDRKRRETRQAQLAAAAANEAQTLAVWRRVYEACNELYSNDPNATVTNQICLNVFLETGLPTE